MPVTLTTRRRRLLVAPVIGALTLTLAACGSHLSPEDVARTDGTAVDGSATGDTGDLGTGTGTGDTGTGDTGTGDTGMGDTGTGTGDTGTGTGDTGTGGTGTGDTGTGDTGTGDSPGQSAPAVSGPTGSCDGFKNSTGITDDSITIGNSSDISGPVPGLFKTAQDALKAYVTYFNTANPDGICGRKLVLKTYDSKTDASADQQAYTAGCSEVFAMIGSTSAFDSGGASTAQKCGLPDLRAGSTTADRQHCTTCYGVLAVNNSVFENAVPDFVNKNYGDAGQHAAYLYSNAGAAAENSLKQVKAMTKRGMHFDYVQGIDVSEFNYTPYVQQLKDKGIQVVFFTSAYQFSVRLRQAMAQQGYKPKLYLRDPTDYNPDYVRQGGDAVDGTVVYTDFVPFEEASSNKELSTYLAWLNQTNPSADPAFFGVFAWSAARMFTDLASKLGGKLTRESLLGEIRKQDNWTANGMTAPQPVGSKGNGECWRFIQLDGSTWKPVGGTKYSCTGNTSTS